jgi:hypothetical protein
LSDMCALPQTQDDDVMKGESFNFETFQGIDIQNIWGQSVRFMEKVFALPQQQDGVVIKGESFDFEACEGIDLQNIWGESVRYGVSMTRAVCGVAHLSSTLAT